MGRTVLIVDDSRLIRKVIAKILEKAGIAVAGEAGTGAEMMALYGMVKPDLVTLDLSMPDSKELEWLKELISLDPAARVIVITSMGEKYLKERAMEMGAKGFLNKPMDEAELIGTARTILGEGT